MRSPARWGDGRPGLHRIRVVAADAAGRTASATVAVHVLPSSRRSRTSTPRRRLPRRARTLTLRLATTLPACVVLTGGGKGVRGRVDDRGARLRVPVLPGRTCTGPIEVARS